MPKENSFGANEKLKSRKAIQELFDSGMTIKDYPMLLVYKNESSQDASVRIGVSVSKRNFKKAVDRNRVKRLIREAYRLNKKELLVTAKSKNQSLIAMFIYSNNTLPTYDQIEKKMVRLLGKLIQKI